MLADNSSLF